MIPSSPHRRPPLFRAALFLALLPAFVLAWAMAARAVTPADFDITLLPPGMPVAEAREILAWHGLRPAGETVCCEVFEATIFDRIFARQRVVLQRDYDRVAGTGLVVDFEFVEEPGEYRAQYEDLFGELITRYGLPGFHLERGIFSPDIAADIGTGRFLRLSEWRTPDGHYLRFGIPDRVDGLLRLELRLTADRLPAAGAAWSIEEVR